VVDRGCVSITLPRRSQLPRVDARIESAEAALQTLHVQSGVENHDPRRLLRTEVFAVSSANLLSLLYTRVAHAEPARSPDLVVAVGTDVRAYCIRSVVGIEDELPPSPNPPVVTVEGNIDCLPAPTKRTSSLMLALP